jgi:hypothetical protein
VHAQAAAVAVNDVFDDGKAKAGAADGAGAVVIDAKEAFGQPCQVVRGDAVALIAHL